MFGKLAAACGAWYALRQSRAGAAVPAWSAYVTAAVVYLCVDTWGERRYPCKPPRPPEDNPPAA